MDNFKRRPAGHHVQRQSLDGFVSANSFKGQGSIGFRDPRQPVSQADTRPLDDLRRPEGYHPAPQTAITTEAVALPPPLLNTGPRSRSRLRGHRKRRLSTGLPKQRSWKKIVKRSFLGVGATMLVIGLYFGVKIYLIEKNIFKGGGSAPALAQNIDISQLKGEGDGRVNILLLGIGGPGHDGADLTDTILLASIDPVNNQASLLSIPRDFWVSIPGDGAQKINAAYTYGKQGSSAKDETGKIKSGLELLDKTLEPILGVPIHYHAVIDFAAFKQAIDAVGGVTFDVPEQLYDPTIAWENGNKAVIAPKGVQTFNGARALLYARSRETSTDFARGERQRQLIVALKDKVLSLGTFSNPLKVSQLLDSFGNNVYTDFNSADIPRLYQIGQQIPSSSIISLDLVTPPHALLTTTGINGLSVVVPKAGVGDYDAIKDYVRNALKDGFIYKENAAITILNGTDTVGLASLKAKELKSYGYNVTVVADAPTTAYTKTLFIDLHNTKKYTRNYLEKRLKVTASSTLPAGINAPEADFVIILGSDALTTTSSPAP